LIWPDAAATTRGERVAQLITRVSWPLCTLLWCGLLLAVYPRTASLSTGSPLVTIETSLAAWLLISGGVVTHKAARAVLLTLGLCSALLALGLLLAARS
jgi:hypothetical protein